MTALERIGNSPLFRPLEASEAAMIEGGREAVATTFGVNPDGSYWHDLVVAPVDKPVA